MKFLCAYSLGIFISYYRVTICSGQLNDEEELWRRSQLPAVVSYENMEALFMKLYNLKFSVHRVPSLTPIQSEGVQRLDSVSDSFEVKNRICESIFSSDYFSSIREKPISPEAWGVESHLRKKQNEIYRDLFKRTNERPWIGADPDDGYKHKYKNPYRLRAIAIHGREEEMFVFSCLVKKEESKDYKQYFISEEYDMGAPFSRSIAGRFVFGLNMNLQLVIHAIAQESAMLFGLKKKPHVEWFYFDKKLSRGLTSERNADPVCKLNLGERLRLCAAIFSTLPFRDNYRFVSTKESVHGDCATHAVSFRNKTVKRRVNRQVLPEWMIPCNPSYKRGDKLIFKTFYVSRAYIDDKVFLFRRKRRGKMVLKYYFYNTGVVDADYVVDNQPYVTARSSLSEGQIRHEIVQE